MFQQNAFLKQARLAEDLKLPVIIHCVKYYYELLKIRKDNGFRTPWIFHGFTQNTDIALKIVASGCYISIGENLCNPSKKIKNCVEKIETNHIFLETDDSSDNIATIYEYYSSLKGVSMESIQIQIEQNLKKCFPNTYATLLA